MSRICFLRYLEEPIIDSIALGFQKLGYQTKTVRVDPAKPSLEEIQREIESFSPDACFTHSFYVFDCFNPSRSLENYLFEKQIPVAVWFLDPPYSSGSPQTARRFLFENISPNILSICCDSGDYEFLQSRKFKSEFLPLAVVDEFVEIASRRSGSRSSFAYDVSFSGKAFAAEPPGLIQNEEDMFLFYANLLGNELAGGVQLRFPSAEETDRVKRILIECFRDGISDFFSKLYVTLSEYQAARERFGNRIKTMLGEFMYNQFLPAAGRLDFVYSWFQLNIYLHRLCDFNIRVFGEETWKRLLPAYSRPTPKLSIEDLLDLFRSSKISFCLTKWHFKNMAHERIPIVLGVGGFPITDFRSDLLSMFDRDELIMYRGLEEARDLIRFYLKNESERKRISEKGRARVLKEHTYSKRAIKLAEFLNRHFSIPLAK